MFVELRVCVCVVCVCVYSLCNHVCVVCVCVACVTTHACVHACVCAHVCVSASAHQNVLPSPPPLKYVFSPNYKMYTTGTFFLPLLCFLLSYKANGTFIKKRENINTVRWGRATHTHTHTPPYLHTVMSHRGVS